MIPKEEEKFDAKAEGATHRFKTYGKAKLSGKALEMLIAQGDFKTVLLFHSHVMHTMNCEDLVGTRSSVASLEGDFHTQINLGNQHSKIFNNEKGKGDVGTYQGLRLAVNRCNVKPQWKNAFAPNEQFLQDLRGVHSSGFAMAELGMEKLSDHPTKNPPPANKKEREVWFDQLCRRIVQQHFSWDHDWTEEPKPQPNRSTEAHRKELLQRHYCKRGCGRSFDLRYGEPMLEHIKKCKFEGKDQRPQGWDEVVREDCKHNYHVQAWNIEMLYEAFHHYIQYGDCVRIVNSYKAIVTLARNHAHYATAGLFCRAILTGDDFAVITRKKGATLGATAAWSMSTVHARSTSKTSAP